MFTQGPQRFPPEASVSSSFGITSGTGSQSTSDFRQSFRPDPPETDVRPPQSFEDEPESFRSSGGTSPSAIDNTFVNFPGRVPLRQPSFPERPPTVPNTDGARVRIRPVGTIGNTDPTQLQPQFQPDPENTSPRARQPLRPEDDSSSSSSDFEPTRGPTGVRVVRVRPTSKPPFRTENFTPSEFIQGSHEVTPPPVITRVRGRPIVPEDFPGSPLAIRGKTPEDERGEEDIPTGPGEESIDQDDDDDSFSRVRVSSLPSATGLNNRQRSRVRIVPTGNRARRPITGTRNEEPEPLEEPRASQPNSNGRPLNRIPFGAGEDPQGDGVETDEDFDASGTNMIL